MNKTTEKSDGDVPHNRKLDKLIDDLTLFDDDLMSRVFNGNIEATELVIRIILVRNVKIISVKVQTELKPYGVKGHSITLDVHAIDENVEQLNIEIQGNSEGAHVKRARYHSSMLDSSMLKKGQPFNALKNSYVIFIYRHDKFKKNLPVYHIDRYVGETAELFGDGSHIIYVNGSYKGDNDIGRLINDFHQPNPDSMHYAVLADSVKHFKETQKGRGTMCEAVENYAKEYAKEHVKEYAKEYGEKMRKKGTKTGAINANLSAVRNLMQNMQLPVEQALNVLGIKGSDRALILKKLQK